MCTRSMSIPQKFMEATSLGLGKPLQNHSVHSLTGDDREDSHARYSDGIGYRPSVGAC